MRTPQYIPMVILFGCSLLLGGCSQPGYHWQVVFNERSDASFRGIAAVDATTCWVSGTGGIILRTTDGGEHWQHLSIPGADSLDFRDIEAFSDDTAVVMSIGSGGQSRVYRTEDGGQTWKMVYQNDNEQGFYDAIAFWNNGYGVLQGDPIGGRLFILRTEDGGQTWQEIPQEQMPPVEEGEYAFAASGTHLVTVPGGEAWIGTGGVRARVLHSADYGKTWNSVSTPMIQGKASTGIFSLAFGDESYAIAVGGDYAKEQEGTDNVMYSDDDGESWQLLPDAGLDFRSAVRFADGTFIAVGPSGSEYSSDRGQTWYAIEGPGFHTLDIAGRTAWAAGREGRIAKLAVP